MKIIAIEGRGGAFTRDEFDKIKRIGRRNWGDQFSCFFDPGTALWHCGEFLDRRGPLRSTGKDDVSPMKRPQRIYTVAPTLAEVIAFFEGPKAVYSIAGVAPGSGAIGYRLVVDRMGRVRGYKSPAGVFSRTFPGTLH